MDKYYIHKTGNRALKVSENDYSEIRFYLDTTYEITTTKGQYQYSYILDVYDERHLITGAFGVLR